MLKFGEFYEIYHDGATRVIVPLSEFIVYNSDTTQGYTVLMIKFGVPKAIWEVEDIGMKKTNDLRLMPKRYSRESKDYFFEHHPPIQGYHKELWVKALKKQEIKKFTKFYDGAYLL